jgi:hypothetical protein
MSWEHKADHYEVETAGHREHISLYSEAWREVGRREARKVPVRLFLVYPDGSEAEIILSADYVVDR